MVLPLMLIPFVLFELTFLSTRQVSRFRPPVQFIGHSCTQDVDITYKGKEYRIPKDTWVMYDLRSAFSFSFSWSIRSVFLFLPL